MVLHNWEGHPMWKKKRVVEPVSAPANPAVVPIMDPVAIVNEIKGGAGGPSMCLLVYEDDAFEIVSGRWNVIMGADGEVSYWVADRMVALMGSAGEPVPMPSVKSLRVSYSYPLATLTTEVLPEWRAAS